MEVVNKIFISDRFLGRTQNKKHYFKQDLLNICGGRFCFFMVAARTRAHIQCYIGERAHAIVVRYFFRRASCVGRHMEETGGGFSA